MQGFIRVDGKAELSLLGTSGLSHLRDVKSDKGF